ncbi:30S ribosomal protein S12 [Candidatus Hodgkinia cicadicola]|nr:30S ribosomal protein S12 [Candidatus Hodgkinia cicadicola]
MAAFDQLAGIGRCRKLKTSALRGAPFRSRVCVGVCALLLGGGPQFGAKQGGEAIVRITGGGHAVRRRFISFAGVGRVKGLLGPKHRLVRSVLGFEVCWVWAFGAI